MSLRNLKSVFVKQDEQSQACLSFAMARKGALKRNHVFSKDFAMNVLTKVWPSTTRPWLKKTFHFYNCLALTFQHCGLGHDKADPCLPVPGGLTQHLPHGNTHLLKKAIIRGGDPRRLLQQ